MKRTSAVSLLAAAGIMTVAATALAVDTAVRPDFGKREFDSNCASCHGTSGKGDGPFKLYVVKVPSDLTVLSKANGGVFPFERVVQVIDGRRDVPAHGSRDMPVWGRDYAIRAGEVYFDTPYDPEPYIRARVIALTEYVSRLQVK